MPKEASRRIEVGLSGLVARGVEGMLQLHHVWVFQLLHDLQLTILVALILEHLARAHTLIHGLQSPSKPS